jgi:hypothetical protein
MSQIRLIIVPFTNTTEGVKDIILFKDAANSFKLLNAPAFLDANLEKSAEQILKSKANVVIKDTLFLGKTKNTLDNDMITSVIYAVELQNIEQTEDTKDMATMSIVNAINDDDIYLSITATRLWKFQTFNKSKTVDSK